jgi:hypothetical protein
MTTRGGGPHPWDGCVRALLYPVQFEPDPLDGLDRVLETVVRVRALGLAPADYRRLVRAALASDAGLASVLPQPHPEPVVRRYLREVEHRLAAELAGSPPEG